MYEYDQKVGGNQIRPELIAYPCLFFLLGKNLCILLRGGWVKMVLSLFHGVDNILECILFVLICTQYMLSSSSYVLYVPKYILSVLS